MAVRSEPIIHAHIQECSADGLAGYIASMSIAGIPAAAKAPSNFAVRQWRTIYDIGVNSAPKVALASASAFGYAAYLVSKSNSSPTASFSTTNPVFMLSIAAVSTVMIAPFTLLAMLPTNKALDTKLESAENGTTVKSDDDELRSLLKTWAGLNGIRSVFPLLGAVIGLCAITS
jgi:hypothetical protein